MYDTNLKDSHFVIRSVDFKDSRPKDLSITVLQWIYNQQDNSLASSLVFMIDYDYGTSNSFRWQI